MRIQCECVQTGFDPVQCALGVQCEQAFIVILSGQISNLYLHQQNRLCLIFRTLCGEWIAHARNRMVIPPALRKDILHKIHASHQEITKCRNRARLSVWWPGMYTELKELSHEL